MHITMAQYNFEGDFVDINERQLEFINKVIQEQDLEVNKVVFEPVGKAGDNFASNVKRITIETEDGNLQMIAKVALSNEALRQIMNTFVLFSNEHIMYTEVLPKLVQLQKTAGVPVNEQLKYAKCYGSLAEQPNEVILLEDLKVSNFVILDKYQSLTDDTVRSMLKNFAVLHSLSYALKNQEPETYDLFKGKLLDIWTLMAKVDGFEEQMEKFENEILLIMEDINHKNIIKNSIVNIFKSSLKLAEYEDSNKYSVIQQGDSWTNNIMFRFEEDTLLESRMIDYQLSKNSNPVVDILYMIFNCTDHETRCQNFCNWINYYHSELDKGLSNFNLKANSVYPREQLDVDLKRYGRLIFGLCLMLTNVLMRDSKEAGEFMKAMETTDMNEMMESMKMDVLNDETLIRIKKRIVGLIDSFTELDLL